ncbi:MAG: hypothetical protein J5441_00795 [Clostridia bacterium]|jgi:uncharacterized membrane protein|nr:hypothetical protein [Clostridia bacterium]
MRNRLKSWVFWSSLAAQALSLLVAAGAVSVAQSEAVNAAVAGVLQAFVSFGVLNNPTKKDGF